jgi:hypothetical protein
MGVVYLAMRDDGTFRKNVALKVLLREQVTPEFIQRFKQERQVLAALDHPNIARILDGGDTPDGMPYYVMEYVEGSAIHKYCDEQRLTLSGRVAVFQQVCEAVNYLHNNSIAHRDLKPANILVSTAGVVKLLDFGIAKVMGASALAGPDVTTIQGTPMTPMHASPEQIYGQPLQKTSDIYALGVILYQLVTGQAPYGTWETKQSQLAARKDPPPPSVHIREDLRARPDSTAQLRKSMLDELDSIVLKSLRFDPQQRYQTAPEFSQDLGRLLSGLPVEAHRNTVAGRSVKLLRRKRAMTVAVVAMLLLAGLAGWQWRRAEVQKAEIASREAEFRTLLEQLETTAADPTKPEAEKLRDLQTFARAFKDEFPRVAAAKPSAETAELLARGVRYLDHVAGPGATSADLGLALADAYQQVAVLQSSNAKLAAVATYQRAESVLSTCLAQPGDTRVPAKLEAVRQRMIALDTSPSTSAGTAEVPAVRGKTALPSAAPILTENPPPARGVETRPQVDTPELVTAPSVAAVAVTTPASPALAELYDRATSVEARIVIAEQTIEPLRKTLEAQGQSINAGTMADVSNMRQRLNQAKRQLAAGNEAAARESLGAAQGLADRVLRTVGR